jgi:hypothetical protein
MAFIWKDRRKLPPIQPPSPTILISPGEDMNPVPEYEAELLTAKLRH